MKGYRDHRVATLFGQVTVRLPRFRCAECGASEAGHGWPSHCRSTPELDRVQAHLSALMPYRVAADVLAQMLPVDAGAEAHDPAQVAAKAVITEEAERLHWRIWNGKAKNAQISIERIRAARHRFQDEQGQRKSVAPSRQLCTALHALDSYLTGQSDWLVNYAERHRAGLRVGTATTEGTANFLVSRRMNKHQQMRWSQRGADLLLQVRCAVYNATLGCRFGQKLRPANDLCPSVA